MEEENHSCIPNIDEKEKKNDHKKKYVSSTVTQLAFKDRTYCRSNLDINWTKLKIIQLKP